MQVNLAKVVLVILSVFLLKITVADTFRDNQAKLPKSAIKITGQDSH
ncbi:hypothetical protein [Halobacteriovorax sp. HLS]|nr:hypothetical protein [Halobacteriovorax sp. HLS]